MYLVMPAQSVAALSRSFYMLAGDDIGETTGGEDGGDADDLLSGAAEQSRRSRHGSMRRWRDRKL